VLAIFILYAFQNYFFFGGNKTEIMRQLSSLTIPSIFAFLFLRNYSQNSFFLNLYKFSTLLSVAILIECIYLGDFSREGSFLTFGPITIAKLILIGFFGYLFSDEKISIKNLILIFISLFVVTISASRGPIYSFSFIALSLLFLSIIKKIHLDFGKICIISLCSIALIIFSPRNLNLSFNDIQLGAEAFNNYTLTSEVSRLIVWKESLYDIFDIFPKGYGMGNWDLYANNSIKFFEYPHNIFIQFLYDGGIFGLLILALLFYELNFGIKSKNIFTICALFFLLVSLFSGTVKDYRYILFFLMIARAFHYDKN
jgi:O-antigen ligase